MNWKEFTTRAQGMGMTPDEALQILADGRKNADLPKKVLTMCSSHQRPDLAKRMIESYVMATQSVNSMLAVYVSEKDPYLEKYKKIKIPDGTAKAIIVYGPKRTMVGVLNYFACEVYPDYDYYSEANDDHVFVTEGWDIKMAKIIDSKNNGCSMAYGHTEQFPTAVMYGKKLIKGLGYMFPPEYNHTYVDRWLMDVGFGANLTIYSKDIIIEHMHPIFNKGKWDNTYYDGGDEMHIGAKIYEAWCRSSKDEDIRKIKAYSQQCRIIKQSEIQPINEPLTCMMTTYDRMDLLNKTIDSYLRTPERPERLYVFDDHGKDTERIKNIILRIPEAIVVTDGEHHGLEANNRLAMESLFKAGAKNIAVIDSDCLFDPGWWIKAKYLCANQDAEKYMCCLFNARVHPSTPSGIASMVKKQYIGGLGLILTKHLWDKHLLSIMDTDPVGWDGALCHSVIKADMHILACSPSMLQHTGWKDGRHSHMDKTSCIADDFMAKPPKDAPDPEAQKKKKLADYRLPKDFGPKHPKWAVPSFRNRYKLYQSEMGLG